MAELKLEPGWMKRQGELAELSVAAWPEWQRKEAGITDPPKMEHLRTHVVIAASRVGRRTNESAAQVLRRIAEELEREMAEEETNAKSG